jgi:hypothetical protein
MASAVLDYALLTACLLVAVRYVYDANYERIPGRYRGRVHIVGALLIASAIPVLHDWGANGSPSIESPFAWFASFLTYAKSHGFFVLALVGLSELTRRWAYASFKPDGLPHDVFWVARFIGWTLLCYFLAGSGIGAALSDEPAEVRHFYVRPYYTGPILAIYIGFWLAVHAQRKTHHT